MNSFCDASNEIYNPTSPELFTQIQTETAPKLSPMDAIRLDHFRRLLLNELRRHARQVSDEQANAIEVAGDGAKESADLSLRDVISELSLKFGERESQMIADIDQALLRIKEGSYGRCVRCNRPIDERRLEALPTARYDAACQAAVEAERGLARPTL